MSTDRNFKRILAPVKAFSSHQTTDLQQQQNAERTRPQGTKTHLLTEKSAKNSSSWQKLLPRTFIFVPRTMLGV